MTGIDRRMLAAGLLVVATLATTAGGTHGRGPAGAVREAAAVREAGAVPACPGWQVVSAKDPSAQLDDFFGVAVLSAANVWAVGDYTGANGFRTLIEHWNGKAWAWGQLPSPNYGTENNTLTSVAATAGNSVWVADLAGTTTSSTALLLHWNGHAWGKAASLAEADYEAIGFSSAKSGWTVGGDKNGRSLALRWNGKSWNRAATPSLKNLANTLLSVTVVSPASAWAVGDAEAVFDGDSTAIEMHWNGHKWSMMTSPAPGANSSLSSVQATPATAPWAVGEFGSQATVQRALVFRCR